ncbi:MAG: family acetyltransferase [Firmicutes bacterium]|nr:family acetyltransferase [Bacillota bacterium]
MDIHLISTNANNDDFVKLTNLLDKEFYETFGDMVKRYEGFNRLEEMHNVIVLYDGIIPVACGSFKRYNNDTVEIKRVFVLKEYRQKGLATKIMQQLEKSAIRQGFAYVILETGVELKPAVELYKSLGYGIINNYAQYEEDSICVCMKKKLV